MGLLAEANSATPGRWVLMPEKGVRFKDPLERKRARSRRRRRQIFMVLLEATGLSLLIGLFPPLRLMLFGTAILAFLLLVYAGLLIKIRADELHQRRRAQAIGADRARLRDRVMAATANGSAAAGDRGSGNGGRLAHTRGKRSDGGSGVNGNGGLDEEELRELGVRIIEEDCHVTIRTPEPVEAEVPQSTVW